MSVDEQHNKSHRQGKVPKKRLKNFEIRKAQDVNRKNKDPRAFGMVSARRGRQMLQRKEDITNKKFRAPIATAASTVDEPPFVVAVVGPPSVGKSTLIRSLVKHYTKQNLGEIKGPVTVVSGKNRRLTFFECVANDINSMIDLAKVADLVLLLVDAKFGFELDTFEMLNILQTHGFPKIMGVLTHLDLFKSRAKMNKTKKELKHRFWTEIYDGAKLFYLSGLIHGRYSKTEIMNLARFISVMKFRPLLWRSAHSYVLADRVEDITHPQVIKDDPTSDRTVAFYGYVRGAVMQPSSKIHIPGAGDFFIANGEQLPEDPCKLPEKSKPTNTEGGEGTSDGKSRPRRVLNLREQRLYAPMAEVGNVAFDKDAMYIKIENHNLRFTRDILPDVVPSGEGEEMVRQLQDMQASVDRKLENSSIQIFETSGPRRKAPSNDDELSDLESGESDSQSDHSDSDHDVNIPTDDDDDDDDDDDSDQDGVGDDDDELENDHASGNIDDEDNLYSVQWKENLMRNAAQHFQLQSNPSEILRNLIYSPSLPSAASEIDDSSSDDDLFRPISQINSKSSASKKLQSKTPIVIETPSNKFVPSIEELLKTGILAQVKPVKGLADDGLASASDDDDDDDDDDSPHLFASSSFSSRKQIFDSDDDENDDDDDDDDEISLIDRIQNRFVPNEDATAVQQDSENESDDDQEDDEDVDSSDEERRTKQKIEKKAMFNAAFDAKKNFETPVEDDSEDDNADKSYFSQMKDKMNKQSAIDLSEFTEAERLKYIGLPIGAYVRLVVRNIPCELIEHFDPRYPVIMGTLLPNEHNLGFMQVRIKKHRWHRRILKTNDPLIISLGWRRFQTLPIYHIEDRNSVRMRMLKYTPEHMHCLATFYGPVTPPNTGFIAFQKLSDENRQFRVCATGVTLDINQKFNIVKKLKLQGYPHEIHKKTAMIRNMFHSSLEVSKFIGAKIKTVSGIRGQIKKPLRSPPGAFRATFEDRILKSDIVFIRSWFTVDVTKYYNPVTSLLLPQKSAWDGMKQIREIRQEKGIPVPNNVDSHYRQIERRPMQHHPIKIPKNLQADLPFTSKPKLKPRLESQSLIAQRAVVLEPKQKEVITLLQQLSTIKNKKVEKAEAKRAVHRRKVAEEIRAQEEKKLLKIKAERKAIYKKQRRT